MGATARPRPSCALHAWQQRMCSLRWWPTRTHNKTCCGRCMPAYLRMITASGWTLSPHTHTVAVATELRGCGNGRQGPPMRPPRPSGAASHALPPPPTHTPHHTATPTPHRQQPSEAAAARTVNCCVAAVHASHCCKTRCIGVHPCPPMRRRRHGHGLHGCLSEAPMRPITREGEAPPCLPMPLPPPPPAPPGTAMLALLTHTPHPTTTSPPRPRPTGSSSSSWQQGFVCGVCEPARPQRRFPDRARSSSVSAGFGAKSAPNRGKIEAL